MKLKKIARLLAYCTAATIILAGCVSSSNTNSSGPRLDSYYSIKQ